MKLSTTIVSPPSEKLELLRPGIKSLFVFADSADTPNDPFCAIIEGKLVPFLLSKKMARKRMR